MKVSRFLSKEKFVSGAKELGKLRPQLSHTSILTASALSLILLVAFSIRMLPIRWGLELSEFDPYFQFRFTEYIVKNGFFSWVDWHDPQRWYPHGFDVAKAAYPGLPLTAAFLYKIIYFLGVPITLKDFCVLFPPFMATLACLAIYFLGKDFGGTSVGLFSSLFLALSITYITRTSVGFFDDETIGLFGIILFMLFFLRAIERNRPLRSNLINAVAAGLSLGYICAGWGASLYPIATATLFVFVLILLKRYTQRLLISYSVTFGLGLFIAIHVPKLSIRFLTTWSVLPVFGVFALLCLCEVLSRVKSIRWKAIFTVAFLALIVGGLFAFYGSGYMGSIAGKFISVLNPFYRQEVPLIESVQEHRVTAWGSIYYEYGIGVLFFAVGLFFAVKNLTERNVFLIIYGLTSLYFASSMVRLLVISAPAVGMLSALGIVGVSKPFITLIKEKPRATGRKKYLGGFVGKEFSGIVIILIFLLLTLSMAFPNSRAISQAYSPVTILSGSMGVRPEERVTEWIDALGWMRENLPSDAVVCSWWDYGYWITVCGNKTSVADNATTNSTQIALIGHIFVSNETEAIKLLKSLCPERPPTYILIFVTIYNDGRQYPPAGFGDEAKWVWMLRIAESNFHIGLNESDYYNATSGEWKEKGKESLIYRLMMNARYDVIKTINPSAAITPPTPLKHFERVYPLEGQKLNSYGGYVPIVAIYKIKYET